MMIKQIKTYSALNVSALKAVAVMMCLFVTGCYNLHEPSTFNDRPIRVQEAAYSENVLLDEVDDAFIAALARHYSKHGNNSMSVVVTYDPRSYRNTAMHATSHMADIVRSLREYGVSDVEASVMPVTSQGDQSRMLVSYNAYTAHAPEGCGTTMPGLNRTPLEDNPNYQLGCAVDTMLARQVSRPADLLGTGTKDHDTDGRSAANIVDDYRIGAQNPKLEGEQASGQ